MGRDDIAVPPGALSPFPPLPGFTDGSTAGGPTAATPQAAPSPYDAAALKATVALLRGRLGEQLMSLSDNGGVDGTARHRAGFGGAGFPFLHS